jgi:hypothetical protein
MTACTNSLDRSSSFLSWWRVGFAFYACVILALGTLPIIGTYSVFSHTTDEPAHIAAGMELLDRGAFSYEQQHPPLARLAVAIGPYLLGARSHGANDIIDEGLAILYTSGGYLQTLRAARLGCFPSLLLLWRSHGPGRTAILARLRGPLPHSCSSLRRRFWGTLGSLPLICQ